MIDAGGGALTVTRIRNAVGDTIYTACGEQPTIGMCPPAVFNYVGSLYDSNRRYQTDISLETPRGYFNDFIDATYAMNDGYAKFKIN